MGLFEAVTGIGIAITLGYVAIELFLLIKEEEAKIKELNNNDDDNCLQQSDEDSNKDD